MSGQKISFYLLFLAFSAACLAGCTSARFTTAHASLVQNSLAEQQTVQICPRSKPAPEVAVSYSFPAKKIAPETKHRAFRHRIASHPIVHQVTAVFRQYHSAAPAMERKDALEQLRATYSEIPIFKLILFSLVVVGIIILAAVLTFQLTGNLQITYLIGSLLILLAIVGSIFLLS